jgi:hypothetical protein
MGSDLHVWSQAMCNAIQLNKRLLTAQPWIWRDQTTCDENDKSAMTCYFPRSELECPQDAGEEYMSPFNLSRGRGRVRNDCLEFLNEKNATVADLRAAATEFLFSYVSEKVQAEAERQLQLVFKSGPVPTDMITVHIRWGDKVDEMTLIHVDQYVQAVRQIQIDRNRPVEKAHVFLATEDPRAVYEFVSSAPDGWTIYVDAYFQEMFPHRIGDSYNSIPQMAQTLRGRPGIVALGSLLVAMEANDFVLTTASNWSRLLNELRMNVVDPRCNHCTSVIDLKHGSW